MHYLFPCEAKIASSPTLDTEAKAAEARRAFSSYAVNRWLGAATTTAEVQ